MQKIDSVLLDRTEEGVAIVTLNRPSVCNAVNAELTRQLEEVATQVEMDKTIRAAILCGAGSKGFSAGADLREVAAGNVAQLSTSTGGFAGFARLPKNKVWIAAVHGAVMAGGLEIMLACDFAIASEDALFALPEVKWGLIASEGGLYRLPRAIPQALAMEMIVTGASIQANRAMQCGLVNRVVPAEQLKDEALAIARKVSGNAPLAVLHSKALAQQAASSLPEDTLHQLGRDVLARLQNTEDFREGPRAFIERRAPAWKGQ
ncbi:enoyl-CoA hydratase-related protein [Pusillimonas sp. SM2304]|uniref:enoyl-CoA hydratase/isomerase family protein n=1 Tax=Pusillimonas sp. SM2304 TaxID=3073241 RepID=UPI002874C8B2|nr:enoyl-CoA hydratase-related protein [Pusillimonas sp. SM2304]MDS1140413.1 enoyl-CoA hydratase-related protein [Pusillimonas sp. SM2304]